MKLSDVCTPAITLDLDALGRNLARFQQIARDGHKALWPMTKTHKSVELARMQLALGAEGLLCGTLDECEVFAGAGMQNLMYAYPVADRCAVRRVLALAKRCRLIVRLDGLESARLLSAAAAAENVELEYTAIIDSGLHRFGVRPEDAPAFVGAVAALPNLVYLGISTHPGQVYAAAGPAGVAAAAREELSAMQQAAKLLQGAGLPPAIVSSGSTPTHALAAESDVLTMLHPGNYAFLDAIQIALGVATEEDCALRVLATVISHPRDDLFIIDAGAKCLGLDQGAHGCALVSGYGRVVGHPELVLASLSEEVGKLHVESSTNLTVGDRVEIVPNHACSSANCTDAFVAVRGDKVERFIAVDARGNRMRRREA